MLRVSWRPLKQLKSVARPGKPVTSNCELLSLRALWSLFDGIWDIFRGMYGTVLQLLANAVLLWGVCIVAFDFWQLGLPGRVFLSFTHNPGLKSSYQSVPAR